MCPPAAHARSAPLVPSPQHLCPCYYHTYGPAIPCGHKVCFQICGWPRPGGPAAAGTCGGKLQNFRLDSTPLDSARLGWTRLYHPPHPLTHPPTHPTLSPSLPVWPAGGALLHRAPRRGAGGSHAGLQPARPARGLHCEAVPQAGRASGATVALALSLAPAARPGAMFSGLCSAPRTAWRCRAAGAAAALGGAECRRRAMALGLAGSTLGWRQAAARGQARSIGKRTLNSCRGSRRTPLTHY